MAKKENTAKRIIKEFSMFLVICTYILLVGCEDKAMLEPCDNGLGIEAESLILGNDGYYRLTWLPNYIQTFTTLTAYTESEEIQKLAWQSNKEIEIQGVWTNLVNPASYSDEEGEAHTVLGVWEEFVGDTITVYCGYEDRCNNHYVDSLKVIIVE
jgi:hypothetical protein